jgi:hypothetical protein
MPRNQCTCMTKKGTRCTRVFNSATELKQPRCGQHKKCKKYDMEAQDRQCRCVKKNGQRCLKLRMSGSRCCNIHASEEGVETQRENETKAEQREEKRVTEEEEEHKYDSGEETEEWEEEEEEEGRAKEIDGDYTLFAILEKGEIAKFVFYSSQYVGIVKDASSNQTITIQQGNKRTFLHLNNEPEPEYFEKHRSHQIREGIDAHFYVMFSTFFNDWVGI